MRTYAKRIVCLVICLLLTGPLRAAGHSGRTDASGGHYNRSTGEYHYHHGYPAHQHTGGVCPYDFDDQTRSAPGAGSGTKKSTTTSSPSSTSRGTPSGAWAPKKGLSKSPWFPLAIPVVGVAIAAIMIAWVAGGARKYRREKEREELIAQQRAQQLANARLEEERRMEAEARRYERFMKQRGEYAGLYGWKTPTELAHIAGMSEDLEIGADNLPKEKGSDHWGDRYTFYIAPSGQTFHRKPTCNKAAPHPVHAMKLGARRPCLNCHPVLPEDFLWYAEYKKIQDIARLYMLPTARATVPAPTSALTDEERLQLEAEHEGLTVDQYQEQLRQQSLKLIDIPWGD